MTFGIFILSLWFSLSMIPDIKGVAEFIAWSMLAFRTYILGYASFYTVIEVAKSVNRLVFIHSLNDIVDVVFLSAIIGYIVKQDTLPIFILGMIALGTFAWKYFFYTTVFKMKENLLIETP